MAAGENVTVLGADRVGAGMARVAGDLDSLESAGLSAGNQVRQRAATAAPVLTGALARSIRVDASGTEFTVGAYVPYAGFQEFGTRYIPASPFLVPALEASQSQIVNAYTGEIQDKLNTIKGA